MIAVHYRRLGDIYELDITGHADYDESGRDIVCAGVSAVAYALLGTLKNSGTHVETMKTEESSGKMHICCTGDDALEPLFQMAVIGFWQIARKYPDHVQMEGLGELG